MLAILCSTQIALAAECVQPKACDVVCQGLPSGYISAGNPNNFKHEDCLTPCNNNYWNLQNEYDACIDAQRVKAAPEPVEGGINKPVQDLQQELNTPGPSPEPPVIPAITAPTIGSGEINTQYLEMPQIAIGQVIAAPADKSIEILAPVGKIQLRSGSSLKYLGEDVWEAIKGTYHFLINKLGNKRFQVRSTTAVISVRGTDFTVEAAADGQTVVKVYGGTVAVATPDGKQKANVAKGLALTAGAKGLAKTAKITKAVGDDWYQQIGLSPVFLSQAWKNTAAALEYSETCVITAEAATPAQALTAEEKKVVAAFNASIPKYRVKEVDAVTFKGKKMTTSKERLNVSGRLFGEIYIDDKNIYYPDGAKGWKAFSEPSFIAGMWQTIKTDNLTYGANQATMVFDHWNSSDKGRMAVYKAMANRNGTDDLVSAAFSKELAAGQDLAQLVIYVDEAAGLLAKFEVSLKVKSGKIIIPIKEICQVDYSAGAKIKVPAKAKRVEVRTGLTELQQYLNIVQ